jgi:hypothetical protein
MEWGEAVAVPWGNARFLRMGRRFHVKHENRSFT